MWLSVIGRLTKRPLFSMFQLMTCLYPWPVQNRRCIQTWWQSCCPTVHPRAAKGSCDTCTSKLMVNRPNGDVWGWKNVGCGSCSKNLKGQQLQKKQNSLTDRLVCWSTFCGLLVPSCPKKIFESSHFRISLSFATKILLKVSITINVLLARLLRNFRAQTACSMTKTLRYSHFLLTTTRSF